MGKQGLELLSSPLGKRLGSSSCNDYAGAKESEHQDHVCRFGRSQVLKRSRSQLKVSSAAYVSAALFLSLFFRDLELVTHRSCLWFVSYAVSLCSIMPKRLTY
jgi:hypothetical protein